MAGWVAGVRREDQPIAYSAITRGASYVLFVRSPGTDRISGTILTEMEEFSVSLASRLGHFMPCRLASAYTNIHKRRQATTLLSVSAAPGSREMADGYDIVGGNTFSLCRPPNVWPAPTAQRVTVITANCRRLFDLASTDAKCDGPLARYLMGTINPSGNILGMNGTGSVRESP